LLERMNLRNQQQYQQQQQQQQQQHDDELESKKYEITRKNLKGWPYETMKRFMDQLLVQNEKAIAPNMMQWPKKGGRKRGSQGINDFLTPRSKDEKGRGLFAKRKITKGTIVLIETVFEQAVQMALPDLSDPQHQEIEGAQDADKTLGLIFPKSKRQSLDDLLSELESMKSHPRAKFALTQVCIDKVNREPSPGDAEPKKTFFDKMSQWHPKLMERNSSDQNKASKKGKYIGFAEKNNMNSTPAATLVRAVSRTMFSVEVGPLMTRYSTGLFPAAAMINHSCHANAARVHVGDHIVIYALDDIEENQEVTINYGGFLAAVQDDVHLFESRDEALKKIHKFLCLCDLCVSQRRLIEENPQLAKENESPMTIRGFSRASMMAFGNPNQTARVKAQHMATFLFQGGKNGNTSLIRILTNSPLHRVALVQWMLFTLEAFWTADSHDERAEAGYLFLKKMPCLMEAFVPGITSAKDKANFAMTYKGQNIDIVCRFFAIGFCMCSMLDEQRFTEEMKRLHMTYLDVFRFGPMRSDLFKLFVAQGTFFSSFVKRFGL